MIPFHRMQYMDKYVEKFRLIEAQIHEMAFNDQVLNFIRSFPAQLHTHIHASNLQAEDIEVVSQTAIDWAASLFAGHSYFKGRGQQQHFNNKPWKGILHFRKIKKHALARQSKSSKNKLDNLDMIESAKWFLNLIREEQTEMLNRMDINTDICYNCNHKGHFAADCRASKSNNSTSGYRSTGKFQGKTNSTIKRRG